MVIEFSDLASIV